MSDRNSLKRRIRSRMTETGESYTSVRQFFLRKAENSRMQNNETFDLQQLLERSMAARNVPGGCLIAYKDNEVIDSAVAGTVSIDSDEPITSDTLFRIGAVIGPMVATVIMQYVEAGKITLDDPILKHLPDFRTADMDCLRRVTVRHLLSHTHGLDADGYTDESGSTIQDLLDGCADLPSVFEPGKNCSRSAVGYSLLGRLIEVLEDLTFEEAMGARLFAPLEMDHRWWTSADIQGASLGHIEDSNRLSVVNERGREVFKAVGSTLMMPIEALHKFASVHVHNGLALTGERILSAASCSEMRRVQFPDLYSHKWGSHDGFGWVAMRGEHPVFWADNAGYGQGVRVIILPKQGLEMIGCVNRGFTYEVFDDVWGKSGYHTKMTGVVTKSVLQRRKKVSGTIGNLAGKYMNNIGHVTIMHDEDQLSLTNDVFGVNQMALDMLDDTVAWSSLGMVEFDSDRKMPSWVKVAGQVYKRSD